MIDINKIKSYARSLGFVDCGIAPVRILSEQEQPLYRWLASSYNGKMGYMENNIDKRLDPSLLVDDAKSVIVVILNYYPSKVYNNPHKPHIAKYAYGDDYHYIIKSKLEKLLLHLKEFDETIEGRCFVDSAPVLEHTWACEAGLGWIGKNSLLITKKWGSYVFIGELIINKKLDYDTPNKKSFCGTCSECIKACPTSAIVEPKIVDARKCISYNTIELKDEIPSDIINKIGNTIYGCDICQDVCPWNKKIIAHSHEEFKPNDLLLNMDYCDWINMTNSQFKRLVKNSPMKRAGLKKIKKTILSLIDKKK